MDVARLCLTDVASILLLITKLVVAGYRFFLVSASKLQSLMKAYQVANRLSVSKINFTLQREDENDFKLIRLSNKLQGHGWIFGNDSM